MHQVREDEPEPRIGPGCTGRRESAEFDLARRDALFDRRRNDFRTGVFRSYGWRPVADLDPLRRSFRMQVICILLPIGIKALLNGSLDREAARERTRHAALARLSEAINTHLRAARDKS